jgi:hypothetical protein
VALDDSHPLLLAKTKAEKSSTKGAVSILRAVSCCADFEQLASRKFTWSLYVVASIRGGTSNANLQRRENTVNQVTSGVRTSSGSDRATVIHKRISLHLDWQIFHQDNLKFGR